jgi:colicin import membrane protein
MPAMDVAERQATLWGIGFAALLHLGLLVFLVLATISCNTWERAIDGLGLPKAWNPVRCSKPLNLAGPVIEATLMGPAGAPLPPPKKFRAPKPKAPPPKVDVAKPKPAPVKTLPPPPKHPDTTDQAKAVALASDKAEQAQREQRQRERQHMSELDAQSNADIDKLFKQMDAAGQQSQRADRQAQKLAQLDDLKDSKDAPAPTTAPKADQARSGGGGTDSSLEAQYKAAITSKMIMSWHRPAQLQSVVCHLHAVQIPGGTVISATVIQPCNADAQTRKSIEDAALRASPLPYQHYEKVFKRDVYVEFCYPKEVCSQ